jgi:hypothetical protein
MDERKDKQSGIFWIIIIVLLVFSAPLWINNNDSNIPTVDSNLVDCKFENCGTVKIKLEDCKKAFCCNLFSRFAVVQDEQTCNTMRSEAILKAVINSKSDTDGENGYDAGYTWAEEKDIDSTGSCSTNSDSFNQGCEDYVCEMAEYYPRDYECY